MTSQSSEFYTREEVAKLLNVAESTVYAYAQQGKIETIENPFRVQKMARYSKASVDQLLESTKKEDDYVGVNELAKRFKVTKQRIYQIINKYDLVIDEVPYGERKTKYAIPLETQEEIGKYLKQFKTSKGAKANFYTSKNEVALLQLFHSYTGESYRIIKNNEEKWGVFLPGTNSFIDFVTAKRDLELKPAYPIHQARKTKPGYAQFKLPKSKPQALQFLDFIYQHAGVENIYIEENSGNLELFVKQMNVSLHKNPIPSTLSVDEIENYLVEGAVFEDEGSLYIINSQKLVTIHLKLSTIDLLHDRANETNENLSDIAEAAVLAYLSKDNK
ncbi:helix-turn-helix domain-containing protein [Viridibacillus arvi]|uniref:helix-turn-helix domain-containing protein n=1 Tax=Viridibacillus arvi TaxID=263475 RepID=UPI003D2CCE66